MDKKGMDVSIGQTKLSVTQGDITGQATDAVVNAANSSLMGGGGGDVAKHRGRGTAILKECKQIISRQGRLRTGRAVMTGGGNLKARFVIHTVGPIWRGGNQGEPELLASAYQESLKVAAENDLMSVSFPSISTGAYGYPVMEAAAVAINAVASFLKKDATSIKEVVFVLFDAATFESYSSVLGRMAGGSEEA
jgi:O-acetyl-ADP-ribose deacetylase (regulator of RNase III)